MKKYKLIILIALITSIVINTSCEEEDQPISNDLRLLTATINGENVKHLRANLLSERCGRGKKQAKHERGDQINKHHSWSE